MAKFNKKQTLQNREDATTNFEDGIAFKPNPKNELYLRTAATLVSEPKFYETGKASDAGLVNAIDRVVEAGDPEFILKLAEYARNKLYLRSVPTFLLVEAANRKECKPFVHEYTPHILHRADELPEALALQLHKHGKPIPNSLKKGLGDTFRHFDEYQLAKYNRNKQVKLRDILRLVHPKPFSKEQGDMWKKVLTGNLDTPKTWETTLSSWKEQGFESKKDAWETVVNYWIGTAESKHLHNYMAVLRNLRNLVEEDIDPKLYTKLLTEITRPSNVKSSKQLPFRFYNAYKALENNPSKKARDAMKAVNKALTASTANLPKLKGTTFMSADNSGSMDHKLSVRSSTTYMDTANLMMAMANTFCDDAITSVFGSSFLVVNTTSKDILANKKIFDSEGERVGWSTHGYKTIQYLNDNKLKVDRIILFTDEQMYGSNNWFNFLEGKKHGSWTDESLVDELNRYKAINPHVKTYIIDLAGYGTIQIPENDQNTVVIGGWSDKVLQFINIYEENKTTPLETIDAIHH